MENGWTERIEELEESRNNWKREWSLLNAALNMAEDRIKELEAERDADRKREYGYSQQTVDALTLERDKLRAERNDWKSRYQSVSEMHDALIAEFNEMRAENKRLCKRIAELEAENHRLIVQRDGAFERWKSAIAKYPNGADGCCCLFDDNENQVQWCTPHAELRDENDALTAERDKLKARVAELEAEMREIGVGE